MNKFYHLHIPKAGGHYIKNAIIDRIYREFDSVGIKYEPGHYGWLGVDEDTYIISSLRDPAKRTVSHFCYQTNFPISKYKKTEVNKNNLFKWIDENIEYISDFQSKNFLYTPQNRDQIFFFVEDEDFLKIKNISKNDVLSRVKLVNILIKDTDLNDMNSELIINKIKKDINIGNHSNMRNLNFNKNEKSLELYNTLSEKEKQYLYDINKVDSDIYFDDSLFWKNI